MAALALLLVSCGRNDSLTKTALGKSLAAKGDYDGAVRALQEAVKLDPKNGDAYYQLGLICWDTGRPGLEGYLRRAVDVNPRNADALGKLGELFLLSYQRHGDPRWRPRYVIEMQEFSSRLLALDAQSYQGIRLRGYAALYSGNYPDAVNSFQSLLHRQPDSPYAPALAGDLVRAWTSAGSVAQAQQFATAYIANHPSAAPVYHALTEYYETHGDVAQAAALLEERCRRNPDDPEPQLSLAAFYRRNNRLDDATRILEQLLAAPGKPNWAVLVGDHCVQQGDLPMAVRAYRLAAARTPSQASAMRLKEAALLRRQHQYSSALEVIASLDSAFRATPDAVVLKDALLGDLQYPDGPNAVIPELERLRTLAPKDGRIAVQLGRAYQALGKMDKAAEQLRVAEYLLPDSAEPQIALARFNMARGDLAHARECAMAAVQIAPADTDAKLIRGITAVEAGEGGEARRNLSEVISALPSNPEARYYLARLSLKDGDTKTAEQAFRKLAAEGSAPASVALADLYVGQKDYPSAERVLQEAMDRNPGPELAKAYAHLSVASAEYDKAIPLLRRLVAQLPADGSVRLDLIAAYQGKGDLHQALTEAKQAEQAGFKDSVLLARLADLSLAVDKDTATARRLYGIIVQREPDNARAGAKLASLMLDTGGDPLQAQGIAEQAMRISPTDPEVAGALARVYERRGLNDQAVSVYRSLLTRYPSNVALRMGYAQTLMLQGQRDQARKELEAALRENPPTDQAALIRAQLDRF